MARGLSLFMALMLLGGCSGTPSGLELHGETMGTTWSVRAGDSVSDPAALKALIESRLEEVNRLMSTWQPDSEISRFNRYRGSDWFPVSKEMLEVLQAAREIHRQSGGSFDPAIGAVVDLWGFGSRESSDVPGAQAVTRVLEFSSLKHLDVSPERGAIRKSQPLLQLDLSGIAKGFAIDRVAAELSSAGYGNYLVEIGGEVRAAGQRPGGGAWRIAVERPDPAQRNPFETVELQNAAVATSGDYRNYFEREGVRYSHLIDPRTGRPATGDLASVTVIAESAMVADAWATALAVLGEEAGWETALQQELAALFIIRDGEGFRSRATRQFVQKSRPADDL